MTHASWHYWVEFGYRLKNGALVKFHNRVYPGGFKIPVE